MSLKEADLESNLWDPPELIPHATPRQTSATQEKMLFQIHQTIGFRSASWSETGAMAGGDEKRN
jgi:hypothetical protein